MKASPLPSVSIVIPTKNRPADLRAAVESLLRQSTLPRQLVIVDQSATDEGERAVLHELQKKGPRVRDAAQLCYIRDPSIGGLALARNRAMEVADGDVWLFLDDDVVLEPDFLREILAVYVDHPEVVGVSGVVTNYQPYSLGDRLWSGVFLRGPFADERQTAYRRAERLRAATPLRVGRLGGGLMSFRADAVRGHRFDEGLRGVSDGEDVDFCVRLGPDAALMITPRARLIHNQSLEGREQAHWLRRHARSHHYLYRRNWAKGFKNPLCFLWLNVGYALVATFASLRRRTLDPWRALWMGVNESRKVTAAFHQGAGKVLGR